MFLVSVWKWLTPLLVGIGALIVGAIIGFLVARHVFTKYINEHPPVTVDMIRAMYRQMGRTPTEKQIRQVMAAMEQAKGK